MVDFASLAETAQTLVEANGRDVTLFKKDTTPANPAEPWRGPDLTAPDPAAGIGPVKAAFVPATGGGFGKLLSDVDESLRRKVDQVCLLATSSVTDLTPAATAADVENADTLRDGTTVYKIVSVGHLKPADTSLLFVLGLRL